MMDFFRNLKMGHKLALAFGACLALLLVISIAAISRMAQMNRARHTILADVIPGDLACGDLLYSTAKVRQVQYR